MPNESDAQAERRSVLLDPIARMCEQAEVPVARGRLDRPGGAPVVALVCTADDGSWDAILTVIRAHTIPLEQQAYNGRWRRDARTGYDLASDGDLVYELQIHENDDGSGGHGPRPLVVFQLLDKAEAAAARAIRDAHREKFRLIAIGIERDPPTITCRAALSRPIPGAGGPIDVLITKATPIA